MALARVAAVVVLTWALLAVEACLGDRGGGRVAVGVGVVAFATGVGFMPYAVKDGLSVEAVAGAVATFAGLVLAAPERWSRPVVAGDPADPAAAGTVILLVVAAFVVGPAVAAPTSRGRRSARRRPGEAWTTSRSW